MKQKILVIALGLFASLLIMGFNFYLIYPWFLGRGPLNLGSIEVSYVSMARFLRDFYPHLSFAPYWYFGFPFHLFYTPVLPFLVMLLNKFANLELWQGYRVITGIGIVGAPISLFLFTWYLTKKIIPAVIAALSYTFLPSLFYFVLPSKEVANDVISQSFFDPRRLVILARWGEGPHIFSLIFLPLAGLFFLHALQTKKVINIVLAAIFIGLTALTNAVGLYGFALLAIAVLFAQLVVKTKNSGQIIKLSITIALVTYGLIAFWYNLSFIATFFGEGGGVLNNYLALFPWGFLILLWLIIVLFFFFQKVVKNQAVIISLVWFVILFLIVYIYYTSSPPEFSEARIELAPQALRLMTEVDMAFSLFLASLIGALIVFFEKRGVVFKIVANVTGVFIIVGLLFYGISYLPYGQKAMSGEIDIIKTGEYEISSWLNQKVNQKIGERVYLAGNYGFYLNYFTNIWQLRGGLFQAKTHLWPEHIFYQINHGKDKDLALAWLKIANIKYIVVNTASSREFYKEFKAPEKFADFEAVYDDRGDIIYEVPLPDKTSQPARLVNFDILSLATPKKADDKENIFPYVAMLDKSTPVGFEVVNNDTYKIKTRLANNNGILLQMTYDDGFTARSNLGSLTIKKDPFGFMVLASGREGDYEITLSHGKTWKIYLGYLITGVTVIILIYLAFIKKISGIRVIK